MCGSFLQKAYFNKEDEVRGTALAGSTGFAADTPKYTQATTNQFRTPCHRN